MHDTTVRRMPAVEAQRGRRWLSGDSLIWLVAATVLFVLAELIPELLRMPLGADEITYIARTSAHASPVMLPPVHGHGAGLLAAPITLLTTSLIALRIWMAVLSGVGLFLAMLCWRGIRPAWTLALAALIIGSLAITQLSGVQVYPDWWAAVFLLALTGLFLQVVNGRGRLRLQLVLIGLCSFMIVLMRPQNIVFILAPAIVASLFIRSWRNFKVLTAIGVGIVLGCANWVGESYLWYGGINSRIHLAGQEPPQLKLYFSFFYQVRVLSGPWYCLPGQCHSTSFPWLTLWWVAFAALGALGVVVAWRTSRRSSAVLMAATGLWVVALYSFLVPFGAPRYLLPAYVLLAILAADAIAWLATQSRWRNIGIASASLFLVVGIATQHIVLDRQVSQQVYARRMFTYTANRFRDFGVRPPCVIWSPSSAYFLGCSAPWTGLPIQGYVARMPGGLARWREVLLPDGSVVYVPLNSKLKDPTNARLGNGVPAR